MSHSHYIAAVVKALRERVHGSIADPAIRNTVETSIRILAGVADALDGERHVAPPVHGLDGPAVHIGLPPENAAARARTGAAITAAVDRIEHSSSALSPSDLALIAWERGLMRQANRAMLALETAPQGAADTADPLIIRREAVEAYFRERLGAGVSVGDFSQAVGGRSRQTVILTLEGNTGLPRELVLQRDHPGGISRHGVADEFPVLSLVAKSSLKGPHPLLLETSPAPIGAPFMVSARSPGKVAGPDYWNPPQDPGLALQLAEQLAILHAIDCRPVEATLKHTLAGGAGWAEELQQLQASWNANKHWPSITLSAAFAWMRRHVDAIGAETTIVHNDTAFHNVLVHEGRISALLDWELAHRGHPAEDLGYCRQFIDKIGCWDAFVDAYVAAGGTRFAPELLDYFSLRALIKLLTLLQLARQQFERRATDDLNMAEVGASFIPKTVLTIADVLDSILARSDHAGTR